MNDSNKKILDISLGSELEELELLAASCRVPTPSPQIILDEDDLDDLDLEIE